MAVDLGDLIENLKREVNPPGSDVFPDATDDTYLGYLQDAFWEARLDGFAVLAAWDNNDGLIVPVTVGGADITGSLQQLLVMYAGMRILRNQILNKGDFRAKAGPVEYETKQSANVLTSILAELKTRRGILLELLSDIGVIPSYYIDALASREDSIMFGETYFPTSGRSSHRF